MALHLGPLEDAAWILMSAPTGSRMLDRLTGVDRAGRATTTATLTLLSGGNDSTTLASLCALWRVVDGAVHVDTGIGIPATQDHVRAVCDTLGLPLQVVQPDTPYAELVRQRGFPGPGMHYKMYQQLKERALRKARRAHVGNARLHRVIFVAGRRRAESARRTTVALREREGSIIWLSPIATWTRADLDAVRALLGVPSNPVSDALGMSGECLCGAFAEPGEFELIASVAPDVAHHISDLQAMARDAGHQEPHCLWGWGAYIPDPAAQRPQDLRSGPLCSTCDARLDPQARQRGLALAGGQS